jgi:hypothetical protein
MRQSSKCNPPWKQGDEKGRPNDSIHIVEYSPMYGGKTGGDTHKWEIPGNTWTKVTAFLVNVWAKIEVGRVEKPDGWSYSLRPSRTPRRPPERLQHEQQSTWATLETTGSQTRVHCLDPILLLHVLAGELVRGSKSSGDIPGKCPTSPAPLSDDRPDPER